MFPFLFYGAQFRPRVCWEEERSQSQLPRAAADGGARHSAVCRDRRASNAARLLRAPRLRAGWRPPRSHVPSQQSHICRLRYPAPANPARGETVLQDRGGKRAQDNGGCDRTNQEH